MPRGKTHDWLNHNCPQTAQCWLRAVTGPSMRSLLSLSRWQPWNRSLWPPFCRRGSRGGGAERRAPDGAWGGAGTNPGLLVPLHTDISITPTFPFFLQSKQVLPSLDRRGSSGDIRKLKLANGKRREAAPSWGASGGGCPATLWEEGGRPSKAGSPFHLWDSKTLPVGETEA